MKLEKIEAGSCDTGSNENCVLDQRSHSKKPSEKQRRIIPPMPHPASGITLASYCEGLVRDGYFEHVEIVSGEIGPIHVLRSRDNSAHSPRVGVGFCHNATCVWICSTRLPWGWRDPFQIFYRGNHRGAAVAYATKLANKVRLAALAEQERLERRRAARLREMGGGQ